MPAENETISKPVEPAISNGAQIDLDELARKVTQLLLFELQIENERLGRE